MTNDEQLREWVNGNSIHNEELRECCPDFSCCKPELLAPLEEREHFAEQHAKGDDSMLFLFLGRALNAVAPDKDVYLAGRDRR